MAQRPIQTDFLEHVVESIPLDRLVFSPFNVRQREIAADLDDLAHSMATFGLQQPIVVQPKGDKYEIVIGQRRYLAAKQLGWEKIPARIEKRPLDPLTSKVISFSENIQRRDLTPRDKAEACEYLLAHLGSVREVARYIGASETMVRRWLGYAAVPEQLKRLVDEGAISRPIATRIAQSVGDTARAVAIAEKIAEVGPAKEQRDRILDALEDSPESPMDLVLRRAEERREIVEITFVLPQRWAQRMELASSQLQRDPGDIAREATIDWLEAHPLGIGG